MARYTLEHSAPLKVIQLHVSYDQNLMSVFSLSGAVQQLGETSVALATLVREFVYCARVVLIP
jgi:hypothetical protein